MESDDDWIKVDFYADADPADSDEEVGGDDEEDLYDLEEEPTPPPPKPASGLFCHIPSGAASYVAFEASSGTEQFVPGPALSVFPEEFSVVASTRGVVCLRDRTTGLYHVANPGTFKRIRLPPPNCEHDDFVDPAVVITFDEPRSRSRFFDDDFDHYHVVIAFGTIGGIFGLESFSSRTWEWGAPSYDIDAVRMVLPSSGVGAHGRVFWRTTIGLILCYNPKTGRVDMISAPPAVERLPLWELGEMEGNLSVTCTDDRVREVEVLYLDAAAALYLEVLDAHSDRDPWESLDVEIPWTLAGQFDSCKLRNCEGVALLRSQGHREVLMFDPRAEMVVAMDLEGRITRTIGPLPGSIFARFIPYVSSSAEISRGNRVMQ